MRIWNGLGCKRGLDVKEWKLLSLLPYEPGQEREGAHVMLFCLNLVIAAHHAERPSIAHHAEVGMHIMQKLWKQPTITPKRKKQLWDVLSVVEE